MRDIKGWRITSAVLGCLSIVWAQMFLAWEACVRYLMFSGDNWQRYAKSFYLSQVIVATTGPIIGILGIIFALKLKHREQKIREGFFLSLIGLILCTGELVFYLNGYLSR